ncbi:MAG: hypothetical protein U9N81_09140 [Bacillota bacterium]|nr:hypothetical protein [Bacillota bacterium]
MQSKFLLLIALVFVITLGFSIMIWRQTIQIEKKAMVAKQRQKAYEKELRKQLWEERQKTLTTEE